MERDNAEIADVIAILFGYTIILFLNGQKRRNDRAAHLTVI